MIGARMSLRVRFAPSPSGYLHVGGARTALFNWLWARKQGGTLVLRVEDTDQERSSVESVRAVLDAMRWLGLDWDEGPEKGGSSGPYFQSERRELYQRHVNQLVKDGKAYRCYCTKEELAKSREAAQKLNPKEPFRYPGTCRDKADDPSRPHVVRFRTPRTGETVFKDRVFGAISTPNAAQYDFVLLRGDGFPIYNLACVVDDHEMGITLVARGKDHIGNTPQQAMLYAALGWEAPEFAHLPLLLNRKGEKLSKRHASVAVQDYRNKGYTPEAVLNYLVRFGWSYGDQEIFTRDQLIDLFDWERVGRADGKFDEDKFADVAFEHLKNPELKGIEDYAEQVVPFLEERGLSNPDRKVLLAALPFVRLRAKSLVDAAHALDYFFRETPVFDEKATRKFLTAESAPVLEQVASLLEARSNWQAEELESCVKTWVEETGTKMKAVAQPTRVALSGRSATPGLFDVMVVLGRERSLSRLRAGAKLAGQVAP